MNPAVPHDPFEELLRQSPRGSAVLLATGLQKRLREAPTRTLAFLKTLLITMLIPAEALARRMILALAASLHATTPPRAAKPVSADRPCTPIPSAAPAAEAMPHVPAFRMQEKLPPVARPKAVRTETVREERQPAAPPALSPEEKLLLNMLGRLNAVLRALHDPDAEARRFLRRHRARKGSVRAPLAFGAPPGLKSADAVLTACLHASDREARAAWSRLCDTS